MKTVYIYKDKKLNRRALIKALSEDGLLRVVRNVTVYSFHPFINEMNEIGFETDLNSVCEDIRTATECLDETDVDDFKNEFGFSKFDYKYGEYIELDGVRLGFEYALIEFINRGLLEILKNKTVYLANGMEYRYTEPDEPLAYLYSHDCFDIARIGD